MNDQKKQKIPWEEKTVDQKELNYSGRIPTDRDEPNVISGKFRKIQERRNGTHLN